MAAIGVGLEAFADLKRRLERAVQDDFDRELLGCLNQLDESQYNALVSRSRGVVNAIRERMKHPDRTGHDIIERYQTPCEQVVLAYLVLAQGVGEDNLFRYVTFAGF